MIARVPQANALPLVLSAKLGLVAVPDTDLLTLSAEPGPQADGESILDRNTVRELIRVLGGNLGMSLLARKDQGFPDPADADAEDASAAADGGSPTSTLFTDPAVRRSLESLDAVWMRDGEPVACFAVESGLAGWESVRRLADLVALHPKLKAPLYAITLPALKAGLTAELHRPALLVPKKPLVETLRLLEWDKLRSEVDQLGERARYLKPEFLEGISEPIVAPKAD
jgi:hypothetical protein